MKTPDAAASKPSPSPSPSASSHYVKTMVLRDWWLVRSETEFEGKSLSVSGLPDEELAVRVFISAPIMRRLSDVTLETVDGVSVILRSFINKQRTLEGGFTYEVFKDFVYGFPFNWEEYARRDLGDVEGHVSTPRDATVNGCDATIIATKTSQNLSGLMSVRTPKKSGSVSCSAKSNENNVGATSGLKDTKNKVKASGNGTVGDVTDVVKARPAAKKSASVSIFKKCNVGATDKKTQLIFDDEASPSRQESLDSPSVIPSDISSLKKSRSGRLLLRPLEFWRNQKAVYDSSRQITGVVGGTPDSGEVLASAAMSSLKRKHKGGEVRQCNIHSGSSSSLINEVRTL